MHQNCSANVPCICIHPEFNCTADILLLDVGVLENLLDGLHGLAEKIHVKFLELSTAKGLGEVVTILEGLDFNTGGLLAGECSLGVLDLKLEFTHSAEVDRWVSAGLLLVEVDEVVDDTVIEIFSSEMGVTSGGKDLNDTVVDGKKGDIETSTTETVCDDL